LKTKNLFNYFTLFIIASLIFLLFIDPIDLFSKTIFYNFQARDLARARDFLNGNLYFYGPEMTGGGNLPGSLYYIVLAIGQLFNPTWLSSWVIEVLFTCFAAFVGYVYFQKKNVVYSITWVILIASAPLTSWFIKAFLNVSYLIPFMTLALFGIIISFDPSRTDRKKFLYISLLSIGIGLQFHFSIICLLPAIIALQILGKFLNLPQFTKKEFLNGLILFLLPSIPHLLWLTLNRFGINIGKPAFYSGEAENAMVSLIYLIKLNLEMNFTQFTFSVIKKIFSAMPFALFPLLFTALYKRVSFKDLGITSLYIIFIFALIPFSNWFLSGQAHRYTIPMYISLLYFTLILFMKIQEEKDLRQSFIFFSLVTIFFSIGYALTNFDGKEIVIFIYKSLFIIISIFLIMFFSNKEAFTQRLSSIFSFSLFVLLCFFQKEQISTERVFSGKSQEGYMLTYDEWKYIINTIYKKTGWSIDDIKHRVYYIGHHVNQAPHLAFEVLKSQLPTPDQVKIQPDGFLISNRYGILNSKKKKQKDISAEDWLLKQNIHADIINAIENENIKFGNNISDRNLILPYTVTNTKYLPKYFHNTSSGYSISEEDLSLEHVISSEGYISLGKNHYLLKWNESRDKNSFCSTGANLKINKFDKNKYHIKIRVIGSTISQITPWISPNWTQSWDNPYLAVNCGGEVTNYIISESIGFNRKYSHIAARTPFFAGNNSFAAPFEKDFLIKCNSKLKSISVGRTGSTIDMITMVKNLPAKRIDINL
jgi:hypothetical protein